MKKYFLTVSVYLVALSLFAAEFNVDGLIYESDNLNTCVLKEFIEDTDHPLHRVVVPKTVRSNGSEYIVRGIADGAFMNNSTIESLEIEAQIEFIPDYLCAGCENLRYVSLPVSVKSVGNAAFYSCSNMSAVSSEATSDLMPVLTDISEKAFYLCSGLRSLPTMPALSTIRESAFRSCRNLEIFNFSTNVKVIEKYAFTDCEKLNDVAIPATLDILGQSAFDGCVSLNSVSLNLSSERIPDYLFRNCKALEDLDISGEIEEIGESSFENCRSLRDFKYWDMIKVIGKNAFSGCDSLKRLILRTKSDIIPEGAFKYCTGLEFVSVWGNVKTIENSAFYGCSALTEIELCPSVAEIQSSAFAMCGNIKNIYCDNVTPPVLNVNGFDKETYRTSVLYVPSGIEEIYTQTPGWTEFYHIKGVSEFPTHSSVEEIEEGRFPEMEISGNELKLLESVAGGVEIYSVDGALIHRLFGFPGESVWLPSDNILIIRKDTLYKKIRIR